MGAIRTKNTEIWSAKDFKGNWAVEVIYAVVFSLVMLCSVVEEQAGGVWLCVSIKWMDSSEPSWIDFAALETAMSLRLYNRCSTAACTRVTRLGNTTRGKASAANAVLCHGAGTTAAGNAIVVSWYSGAPPRISQSFGIRRLLMLYKSDTIIAQYFLNTQWEYSLRILYENTWPSGFYS